jgi:hypothetical protein
MDRLNGWGFKMGGFGMTLSMDCNHDDRQISHLVDLPYEHPDILAARVQLIMREHNAGCGIVFAGGVALSIHHRDAESAQEVAYSDFPGLF